MVGENRQSMVRPVQFRIVRQHYSGALIHDFYLSLLCCAIHQALIVVDSSFVDEFAIYSPYAAQDRKKQTFLIGNEVVNLYQR